MWSGDNEQWDNCFASGNRNEENSPEALSSFQMWAQKMQPVFSPDRLLDSMKTFEHNTNASPQVTPVMPTITGDSNPSSIFQVEHFFQSGETSTTSGHKRKRQEKETLFAVQPTEMQNNNPKRQAVLETIVGGNIPISLTVHDVVDHPTLMGAQPSLESISTQPLNLVSSIENTKLLFNNLIALPLKDLINPENEASMKNALSILTNNLSLFPEELADQILELSFEFPILVHSWRECYSQLQIYSQKSSAETEKIRDLVGNSERDEESLKVRYEELENMEKELMRQLEAVQKEKAEIAEHRMEKSKQTKDLMEKEAHLNKGEHLMRIATTKLNNLSDQWAKLQLSLSRFCW